MGCGRGHGSCGVGVPFQAAHRRRRGRRGEWTGRGAAALWLLRCNHGVRACRINCRRARSLRGRCSPRSYKSLGARGQGSLPLPLTSVPHTARLLPMCVLRRFGFARAPFAPATVLAPHLVFHGSSDSGAGPFLVAPVDGDPAVTRGASDQRAADAGRRRPAPDVDDPAVVGREAQPPTRATS
jgi:hypothetical protein